MTIAAKVPQPSAPAPTPARRLGDLTPEELFGFARRVAVKIRCVDVLVDVDDVAQELWLWASALAARRPGIPLATARKGAWREGVRLAGGKTPAESLTDSIAGDPGVAALSAAARRARIRDAQVRSKRSTTPRPRTVPLDSPVAKMGLARLARREHQDLADRVAERLDDRARLRALRPHLDAELEPLPPAARAAVAWRVRRRLDGPGGATPGGAGLARSARVLNRVEARASTGVVGACPRPAA